MKSTYIFLLVLLASCSQNVEKTSDDIVKFEDLVNIEDISNIQIGNNNGKHTIKESDREKLINLLGNSTLIKSETFKLGSKFIELTINGEKFILVGRTNGDIIEVRSGIVTKNKKRIEGSTTLYFKVDNLNIDNY